MKTTITRNMLAAATVVVFGLCGIQNSEAKPTVTVDNTEANPVPVTIPQGVAVTIPQGVATAAADNPAFQPYQAAEGSPALSPNGHYLTAKFDVPAGKRLVIELVTIKALVGIGQNISEATVTVKHAGVPVSHYLTPTLIGPSSGGGYPIYIVSQPLRLYCDAGTGAVEVQVERNSAAGTLFVGNFAISGYLVDVP